MSTAVIAITPHGLTVAEKIRKNISSDFYAPVKIINDKSRDIISYDSTLKELINGIWNKYDSLIFIMALGIVNRVIKEHIRDKHIDPAVVVVDEMGRYAISALSGHEGGANHLSEKIALICGGDFVVTTGSEATKTLIVGMGCRRGVSADRLEEVLMTGLERIGRELREVRLISSIEHKSDEEGFYKLSEKLDIPLKFISRTLIKSVEDNFSKSELVNKNLGVSSVAEPCAILGGFRCRMLLPKMKMRDTTLAIAEERFF